MNNKSALKPYIAAISQAVTVGFSFLAIKAALNSESALDLLAHRFTIAVIAVFIVSISGYVKEKLTFKDLLKISPYGLVYPIAMFLFQTIGMKYVSTSESGIINALAPIITFIIAAIILHEHITIKQAFFMILSVCGVIFINYMNRSSDEGYNLFGIMMISASVISLSLYGVLIKRLSSKYSTFSISSGLNLVGFVFFNIAALGTHISDNTVNEFFVPFTNIHFLIAIIFLGVGCSLMTAMLNAYALKTLPAVSIGLLNNLSTIVSILAGVFILKEAFHWYYAIGIIVIIIGTISFNFSKGK